MPAAKELRFEATRSRGEVSALLLRPAAARWLLVLGHGAGAGMRHTFMEEMVERLAARSVASLRYQFPYTEAGKRRPDPQPILLKTVRSAVGFAGQLAPDLPLFAGGKSMGGRMTSLAAAAEPRDAVRGLVFLGFPLHAIGKPSKDRADHLADVAVPMLFLQGDRDRLADLDLLAPVVRALGPQATLHVEPGADHSFKVLKRSGLDPAAVLDRIADRTRGWLEQVTPI